MSASASFVIDAAIRGYHVYKEIWPNPIDDEQLICERKVGNSHNPLAVAIKKLIDGSNTIVGHVPRRISPLCSVFIRRGGSITCVVDGPRRYSSDLPQGGLELPCKLIFSAPSLLESNKMKKLVQSAMEKSHLEPANNESTLQSTTDSQFTSMNGVTTEPSVMDCSSAATQGNDLVAVDDIVCSPPKKRCKAYDDEGIIMGSELTDMEINFAQQLLKAQFTSINGLESTLHQQLQKNATVLSKDSIRNIIQILFCQERKHWIVATTVNCSPNEVKVYDSLFQYLDKDSLQLIEKLFWCDNLNLDIKMTQCRKQKGGKDCGVFAIAIATAIASGLNPSRQNFKQEAMRGHLIDCFNKEILTPFPCK